MGESPNDQAGQADLTHGGERFRNRRHALDWLKSQGHKISQGKFYRDAGAGFPAVHRDGSVSRWQVMAYAEQLVPAGRGVAGTAEQAEIGELARQKLLAEIEWKQGQAAREAFRLDVERGKYLPREEVETMLAARAAILDADFQHLAYTESPRLVALVNGDPARTDQLIEALLAARDGWLDRYATTREFVVEFQPSQDGGDDDEETNEP